MILWMMVGVSLSCLGGSLLFGLYTCIRYPDTAKVMDIEVTTPLMVTAVVFASILIASGYYILSGNLLAASSVLQ